MPNAYCPDCDEKIILNSPRVGQKSLCPNCDTEVEVIGLDPLGLDPLDLDWAYDTSYDEDWADEGQDY